MIFIVIFNPIALIVKLINILALAHGAFAAAPGGSGGKRRGAAGGGSTRGKRPEAGSASGK